MSTFTLIVLVIYASYAPTMTTLPGYKSAADCMAAAKQTITDLPGSVGFANVIVRTTCVEQKK